MIKAIDRWGIARTPWTLQRGKESLEPATLDCYCYHMYLFDAISLRSDPRSLPTTLSPVYPSPVSRLSACASIWPRSTHLEENW